MILYLWISSLKPNLLSGAGLGMLHKNIDIRSLLILVDGSHPTDIIIPYI